MAVDYIRLSEMEAHVVMDSVFVEALRKHNVGCHEIELISALRNNHSSNSWWAAGLIETPLAEVEKRFADLGVSRQAMFETLERWRDDEFVRWTLIDVPGKKTLIQVFMYWDFRQWIGIGTARLANWIKIIPNLHASPLVFEWIQHLFHFIRTLIDDKDSNLGRARTAVERDEMRKTLCLIMNGIGAKPCGKFCQSGECKCEKKCVPASKILSVTPLEDDHPLATFFGTDETWDFDGRAKAANRDLLWRAFDKLRAFSKSEIKLCDFHGDVRIDVGPSAPEIFKETVSEMTTISNSPRAPRVRDRLIVSFVEDLKTKTEDKEIKKDKTKRHSAHECASLPDGNADERERMPATSSSFGPDGPSGPSNGGEPFSDRGEAEREGEAERAGWKLGDGSKGQGLKPKRGTRQNDLPPWELPPKVRGPVARGFAYINGMTEAEYQDLSFVDRRRHRWLPFGGRTNPKEIGEERSRAIEIARFFVDLQLENNPRTRMRYMVDMKTRGSWHMEFDKLFRIDRRDFDEAMKVVEWVSQNPFWRANCQCPKSLRKQYDRLWLEIDAEVKKNKK